MHSCICVFVYIVERSVVAMRLAAVLVEHWWDLGCLEVKSWQQQLQRVPFLPILVLGSGGNMIWETRKYDLRNQEIWPAWETKLVFTALLIAIYVGKCLNQNCADYKGIKSKACSLISQQCSSTLDCRRKSLYNGSVVSLTRCVILYLLSCVTQNYLSRPESTRGSRALS